MELAVRKDERGFHLEGDWGGVGAANVFLGHLVTRGFASATVRAYAYDVLNFARFLSERGLRLVEVVPQDLFDWVEWQQSQGDPWLREALGQLTCRSVAGSEHRRIVLTCVRDRRSHQA